MELDGLQFDDGMPGFDCGVGRGEPKGLGYPETGMLVSEVT